MKENRVVSVKNKFHLFQLSLWLEFFILIYTGVLMGLFTFVFMKYLNGCLVIYSSVSFTYYLFNEKLILLKLSW